MESLLFSYLSLQHESKEEQKYILGLISQFESAKNSNSYHLALFAYHLIFMVFVYQTIYKAKLWKLEQFTLAFITSPTDKRKQYVEASSVYAFSEIPERTIFNLLNLFGECELVVSKCKKQIVDYRNDNLGHANLYIVSEEEFENKVEEYDQIASEIHQLTHIELAKIFDEYFQSADPTLELTRDDIEIDLIIPHRLSDKDLESLASECLAAADPKKEYVSKILRNDFGIYLEPEDIEEPRGNVANYKSDLENIKEVINPAAGNLNQPKYR